MAASAARDYAEPCRVATIDAELAMSLADRKLVDCFATGPLPSPEAARQWTLPDGLEATGTVDISVKLRAGTAGPSDEGDLSQDVVAAARDMGLDLRPMHPGIDDPELASYFTADGGDDRVAAEVAAARLNELDAVEGAYVSPAPEPAPGPGR